MSLSAVDIAIIVVLVVMVFIMLISLIETIGLARTFSRLIRQSGFIPSKAYMETFLRNRQSSPTLY